MNFTVSDSGEVRDDSGDVILSLEQREGRNRSVIARKSFERGDIIVQEAPYAMIVLSPYCGEACRSCGYIADTAKGEQLYCLSDNDPVRYCSELCLKVDSAVHQLELKAAEKLARLSVEGNTDALRLIIRMAALKKQEVNNLQLVLGVPDFPLFGRSNLFAHVLSLEAPTESVDSASQQDLENVADALESLLEDADIPLCSEDVNHLLLAIQSNAHCILDNKKRRIGLGAYPFLSMLNHSCSPNCSHYFVLEQGKLPLLVMQAIEKIEEGSELCYNYIPLYQSTYRRREILHAAYSFECDCRRCVEASSMRESGTVFNQTALYPGDQVLSDWETSSKGNELKPNNYESKSSLNFYNTIPCEMEKFRSISSEVSMCDKLLTTGSSNIKACKSIAMKSIKFFSDKNKAGCLHPCHELILNSYLTCARACNLLLSQQRLHPSTLAVDEVTKLSQAAVGIGGLALGCIIKFTRIRNDDVSELESIISLGCQCLVGYESKKCCHVEELTMIFVEIAGESLKCLHYVWADESIISELLKYACRYAAQHAVVESPLSLSQAFFASSES